MRLKRLRELQRGDWLHLNCLPIADADIRRIARLEGVAWLDLRFCKSVTDTGVLALAATTSLTHLDLGGTGVTDACAGTLAGLPSLECLDLAGTALTGAALEELVAAPKLNILSLWGAAVTGRAVGTFKRRRRRRGLPEVQVYFGVPVIYVVTFNAGPAEGAEEGGSAKKSSRRKVRKRKGRAKKT